MNYEDANEIVRLVQERFPDFSCALDPSNDRSTGYIDVFDAHRKNVVNVRWHADPILNGVTWPDGPNSFSIHPHKQINSVEGVMECLGKVLGGERISASEKL
jgi:hypothetical protein